MKIKIEYKRPENLPENVEKLSYGDGYLVDYYDVRAKETRFGMGIWRGPEFEFPAFTFRDAPVMDGWKDLEKNRVMGWVLIKDLISGECEETEEFVVEV